MVVTTLHTLHDGLLLPLAVEEGTAAAPHAVVTSHDAAPQAFQRRSGKGWSGRGKT